jgi:hypothetical protein
MFFLKAPGESVERFVVTFAEHGGLSESPAQVGVAELGASQPLDLAGTGDGAFDQARVAQEVAHRGEALDGIDLVEEGQPQGLADSRDASQQGEVARFVAFGDGEQFLLQSLDGVVVADDEFNVVLEGETLPRIPGDFEKRFEPFLPVVAEFGNGLLVSGELPGADALEQFDALPDVGSALAEQVAHGALFGRVDIGRGNEVAAQQVGQLLRIDAVVLVLSAVDGLEVERVGEDEFEAGFLAGIGEPVPAEEALAADGHVVPPGSDFFEEELEVVILDVHVQEFIALRVHDADVHLPGVEVDSTVVLGCRFVEFHLILRFI